MKVGVLLAGCGVYDGSEIHEAVLSLLAIDELGHEAVCVAPDKAQHHVVNHLTGEEMPETRNVLAESARIARGNIRALAPGFAREVDLLLIPGGFGAAKNLNQWALKGPDGEIDPNVRQLILEAVALGKPVVALCMGPTVLAKALEGSPHQALLTVGSSAAPSPYDIAAISAGMNSLGATAVMKTVDEVAVDERLKLVTAPCYMMEASIGQVRQNVLQALREGIRLAEGQ